MFNQFIIKTQDEFRDSILRTLGQGTFDIEIWPENWFDIFGEAYEYYVRYAYNYGFKTAFIPIIIGKDVTSYDLSKHNVISTLKIYTDFDEFGGSLERLSMYQGMMGDMFSTTSTGAYIDRIGDFMIDYANFNTMKDIFRREYLPTYYRNTGTMEIKPAPQHDSCGFIECYVGERFENLFNDMLFRKLVTAIAKKQWHSNLAKFKNLDFAGKGEIDLERLKTESKEEYAEVLKTIKDESNGVEFVIQ